MRSSEPRGRSLGYSPRVGLRSSQVCPSGKTPRHPSIPPRKNIPLYRNSELRHTSKQPGPRKRGGSRVVRNAGRVAVDAAASAREVRAGRVAPVSPRPREDERRCCVRQNRVVLAVVATVKPVAEMCASPTGRTASAIRGAREARGKVRLSGEHGISRPTIA